jgi:hypothetical protein
MYDIAVSQEELGLVETIDEKWSELFLQAKYVDRSLIKVKKKFTLVSAPPHSPLHYFLLTRPIDNQ